MTTATVTVSAGTILALDLGKYKSVACAHGSPDAARFEPLATDHDCFGQLFASYRPVALATEVFALAGWVLALCAGCPLFVPDRQTRQWRPDRPSRPGRPRRPCPVARCTADGRGRCR